MQDEDEIENQNQDKTYKEWENEYLVDCNFYLTKDTEISIEEFYKGIETKSFTFAEPNPYKKFEPPTPNHSLNNISQHANAQQISNAIYNNANDYWDTYNGLRCLHDDIIKHSIRTPILWITSTTEEEHYYCDICTITKENNSIDNYLKMSIFFVFIANVYYDEYTKQVCFLDNLDDYSKVKLLIYKFAVNGNWIKKEDIDYKLKSILIKDAFLIDKYPKDCIEWSYDNTQSLSLKFWISSFFNMEDVLFDYDYISADIYKEVYTSIFGKIPTYSSYVIKEDGLFDRICCRKIVEIISENWIKILEEYPPTKLYKLGIECNNMLFNARHENNEKLIDFFIYATQNVFKTDYEKFVYKYSYNKCHKRFVSQSYLESYLPRDHLDCSLSIDKDDDLIIDTLSKAKDVHKLSIIYIDDDFLTKPKLKKVRYHNNFIRCNRVLLATDEDFEKLEHSEEIKNFVSFRNFSLDEVKYIDRTFQLFPLYKAIYLPIYTRYFMTHNIKTDKKLLLKIHAGDGELAIFHTNEENKILFNEPDFKYIVKQLEYRI